MEIVQGVETSSHRSLNYVVTLPKPVDYIKVDCHVVFPDWLCYWCNYSQEETRKKFSGKKIRDSGGGGELRIV